MEAKVEGEWMRRHVRRRHRGEGHGGVEVATRAEAHKGAHMPRPTDLTHATVASTSQSIIVAILPSSTWMLLRMFVTSEVL